VKYSKCGLGEASSPNSLGRLPGEGAARALFNVSGENVSAPPLEQRANSLPVPAAYARAEAGPGTLAFRP
jgi:hypothetical protein